MSSGRRQHTVPRFYLEQFFPGFCYRYGAKSPYQRKKAKKVAVQKNYYGGPDEDLTILDNINSFIESEAAPALQKLIYDTTSITRNDWVTLSYYFANIYIRTPAFHESMKRDFQEMTEQLNQMARDMMTAVEKAKAEGKDTSVPDVLPDDDPTRFTVDELNEWVEEMDTEKGRLSMMAEFYGNMKNVAEYIQLMSLFILYAPGGLFFVTTDNPLILLSMSSDSTLGAGWGKADAFAIMPLDPKHFMTMFYSGPPSIREKDLTADEVHFWNFEIMKYASNEVYSKYPYDMALDWMHRRGQWAPKREKK